MNPLTANEGAAVGASARRQPWLAAYFLSGWAFFLPYLLCYLLYAALRWPVNAGAGCLVHAYWVLHGVHLVLLVATVARAPLTPAFRWRLVPWVCLALFFWIPGAYLEFPSDPWEHYSRINEWSRLSEVTGHYAWFKSSYFLAYSFMGWVDSVDRQLAVLGLYYTGCCLLLALQYYRLARQLAMGEGAALSFAVLQCLLTGNNLFSFHRYYGLSSSILAQIGVIALLRLGVHLFATAAHPPTAASPATYPVRSAGLAAGSGLALLLLVGLNHAQGIVIAVVGITGILCWRLVALHRRWAAVAGLSLVVLNGAALLWFPRHPLLDATYVPEGWLTSWYGFNWFSPSSPTLARALEILGAPGLVCLFLACYLVGKNRVEGWLMIAPVALLSMPLVTIPLTSLMAMRGDENSIITFHRFLLGMPLALPLVACGLLLLNPAGQAARTKPILGRARAAAGFYGGALIVLGLVLLPPGSFSYGRLYHALVVTPEDLRLTPILKQAAALKQADTQYHQDPASPRPGSPTAMRLLTPPGIAFAYAATGRPSVMGPARLFSAPTGDVPSARAEKMATHTLREAGTADTLEWIPSVFDLITPQSYPAYFSKHWLPSAVALEYTGVAEFATVPGVLLAPPPFPPPAK